MRESDIAHPDYPGFRRVEISSNIVKDTASRLSKYVIGQDEAVNIVARAILRAKSQMTNPKQPLSAFMFLGRTGVGKTELAIALAKVQHGNKWDNYYKRIDCTSLKSSADITKISGSSPGYVGYGDPSLITADFLKQEGGVVVVFDEFEKAHSNVQKLLLPILQEGVLTVFAPTAKKSSAGSDSKEIAPTVLDFSNAFIIFTSNIGAEALNKSYERRLGFQTTAPLEPNNRGIVLRELRKEFSNMPEFLGRIGEGNVLVFNDLGPREHELIFDKFIRTINADQRGIRTSITITPRLKKHLLKEAIGDGRYGARDIEHVIADSILTKVAEGRSSGVLTDGSALVLDLGEDGSVALWTKPPEVILPNPLVLIGGNQPISPAAVSTGKESKLLVGKRETILKERKNIPFKINPSFKMAEDNNTGESMEQIKIRVSGVGAGLIQLTKFISSETQGGDPNHFYTLAVKMRASNHGKIPIGKIIIPAGEYKGAGNVRLIGRLYEANMSEWKDKDGNITPLIFSRTDFDSLEIVINRIKANRHKLK